MGPARARPCRRASPASASHRALSRPRDEGARGVRRLEARRADGPRYAEPRSARRTLDAARDPAARAARRPAGTAGPSSLDAGGTRPAASSTACSASTGAAPPAGDVVRARGSIERRGRAAPEVAARRTASMRALPTACTRGGAIAQAPRSSHMAATPCASSMSSAGSALGPRGLGASGGIDRARTSHEAATRRRGASTDGEPRREAIRRSRLAREQPAWV